MILMLDLTPTRRTELLLTEMEKITGKTNWAARWGWGWNQEFSL